MAGNLAAPFNVLPPAGASDRQILYAIYNAIVDSGGTGGGGSGSQPTGAANAAFSQTALSTSATKIANARATRTGILIRNMDESISVYVGPSGVTSTTGMLIQAGESLPASWVGEWYAIAASGTPRVSVIDEYA